MKRKLTATAAVPAALLLIFCIYPIALVMLTPALEGGWKGLIQAATQPAFLLALRNSVVLGVTVAVLASAVGYVFAFAVSRTAMPFRRAFHALAILPLLSPPFVVSLAMILLFGRSGVVTKTLLGIRGADIHGFASLAAVQVLSLFPLAYLNLRGMLETMDGSMEDAGRTLGAPGWRVFLGVTLPLGFPALLTSMLVVFAKSISDFGNPQVLAGDFATLSVRAYLQVAGHFDLSAGAFTAGAILLASLMAFCIQRYWSTRSTRATLTGKGATPPRRIDSPGVVAAFTIFCGLVSLAIVTLYGTVLWVSLVRTWGVDMGLSWRNFQFVLQRGCGAVFDTVLLSVVATPATVILGMALAYLSARGRFRGAKLLGAAAFAPFAVPGMALGIGYILAFNERPLHLSGGWLILVAALAFRNLPVGVEAGRNSLGQIDPSLEEASATLGAGPGATFRRLTLPLMRHAVYLGMLNAFVRSMTSVSAVVFLVSVDWNLLTVSILSEIESGRLGAASAYCVVLMAIVGAVFLLFGGVFRKYGWRM